MLPPPSLPSLPLECLQVILQLLKDQSDRTTLARLSQVSRYLCSVTLPFLYAKIFSDKTTIGFPTRNEAFLTTHAVIQTLLRQQPQVLVSDLLSAAYDVFPERDSFPRTDNV